MMSELVVEEMAFDNFGFLKVAASEGEEGDYRCHEYSDSEVQGIESSDAHAAWTQYLSNWKHHFSAEPSKIIEQIRVGLPNSLRGSVWKKLLNVEGAKSGVKLNYQAEVKHCHALTEARDARQKVLDEERIKLAKEYDPARGYMGADDEEEDAVLPTRKSVRQIRLDLDRTFYTHQKFMQKDGPGQMELFRILSVYAKQSPEVGYCQGMAYIAAVLLMHMCEEDAFWALYVLMEDSKFLKGFYSQSLEKVQDSGQIFQALIARRHPRVSEHMVDLGIHPLMYLTQWFMCAFTSLPLWDTVMGMWDALMLNGYETFFRCGMAIIEVCFDEILAMDSLSLLLPYLQHLPPAQAKKNRLLARVWEIDNVELAAQIASVKEAMDRGVQPEDCIPAHWEAVREKRRKDAEDMENMAPVAKKGRSSLGSRAGTPKAGTPVTGVKDGSTQATPSVFKRFLNALATPLKRRAEEDMAAKKNAVPLRGGRSSSYERQQLLGPAPIYEDDEGEAGKQAATTSAKKPTEPSNLSPWVLLSPKQKEQHPLSPKQALLLSPKHGHVFSPGIPEDARSPYFHRSGILSPSFRPAKTSGEKTPDYLTTPFKKPHETPATANLIDLTSPTTKESFAAFTAATPLRPSQMKARPTDLLSGSPLEMTVPTSTSRAKRRASDA